MVAALKIFLGMEDICIKGLLKRLGHDYFFKKKKLILGFVRVLVTNIFHGKKTGNIGKMLWETRHFARKRWYSAVFKILKQVQDDGWGLG